MKKLSKRNNLVGNNSRKASSSLGRKATFLPRKLLHKSYMVINVDSSCFMARTGLLFHYQEFEHD